MTTSKASRGLLGLLIGTTLLLWPTPAGAGGGGDGRDGGDVLIDATGDDDEATGTVEVDFPGGPGGPGTTGGGSSGPNCTKSDGTRDYLHYEGLQYTTMEDQYTEIRPEEQRPGVYLHVYCGDEYVDFQFFPDGPPVPQIDPRTLAESVTITPDAPGIRTSPVAGQHLVNLDAWFWTEEWETVSESATAGFVTVTVTAEPSELIIDPGDGSASFTCAGPAEAYDDGAPASSQSSDCTYTYRRAGRFTATATVVYDVSFTSNIGVSGDLPAIDTDASVPLAVRESQAVVG